MSEKQTKRYRKTIRKSQELIIRNFFEQISKESFVYRLQLCWQIIMNKKDTGEQSK